MSILDFLISKVAPHDCIACGKEGRLLCFACESRLITVPEQCYRCHNPSSMFFTCAACFKASNLRKVSAATVYDTVAKALVWKLKLAGTQSATRIMAKRMASHVYGATNKSIVVPIPTATSRIRQRGYDQASLIARELAIRTRLPYHACLSRLGQMHQHGASRHERLLQLTDAFRVIRPVIVRGKHVILVDDVITTGATLEAAAKVLHAAGAIRVDAVAFAQTPLG